MPCPSHSIRGGHGDLSGAATDFCSRCCARRCGILVGDAAIGAVVAGFIAIAISLLVMPLVAHEALVSACAIPVELRVQVVGNPVLSIEATAVGAITVGVFVASPT